jgi:hypothetical protein
MSQIKLFLQDTKRVTPIGIDGFEINVSTTTGYKVIAGESNVTEIELQHSPLWDTWIFKVEMQNANGAWETASLVDGLFKIPDVMTVEGYTKIYISCTKGDLINRWERFDLKVWSTSPNWSAEAESKITIPTPAPDQAGKVIMVSPDGKYVLGNGGAGTTVIDENGIDITQDVLLEINFGPDGASSFLATPEELSAIKYTNAVEPYTEAAPTVNTGYANSQDPYTK